MTRKRKPEEESPDQSKRGSRPHGAPRRESTPVVFDKEDIIGDGSGPLVASKRVGSGTIKSGKEPLTAVTGPTAGQESRLPGHGAGSSAAPTRTGTPLLMRVKSYRQSSESSLEPSPMPSIGSLYLQSCFSTGSTQRRPDLAEWSRRMIRNIPVEERQELSGYDDGNLEKVQACLAEVIFRRPFLTRPFFGN